ncbi:MAG: hypothetical protein JRN20_03820 [Nitrososphaerota archaeon]|nr:hypothetical protein [Nitrososphaerota archaeon]MDG6922273.1 hypothetical protein [Nitrososphaerota archaeon]
MKRITGNKHRRAKKAASEVMGSIILIGVTLSIGFAAWAWASGAARTAEGSLNNSVTENFVILNANFSSTSNKVTVLIYNPQAGTEYVSNLIIANSTSTWSYSNSTLISQSQTKFPSNCVHCLEVQGRSVNMTTINIGSSAAFKSGVLYIFKITGEYGTVVQYGQVR